MKLESDEFARGCLWQWVCQRSCLRRPLWGNGLMKVPRKWRSRLHLPMWSDGQCRSSWPQALSVECPCLGFKEPLMSRKMNSIFVYKTQSILILSQCSWRPCDTARHPKWKWFLSSDAFGFLSSSTRTRWSLKLITIVRYWLRFCCSRKSDKGFRGIIWGKSHMTGVNVEHVITIGRCINGVTP